MKKDKYHFLSNNLLIVTVTLIVLSVICFTFLSHNDNILFHPSDKQQLSEDLSSDNANFFNCSYCIQEVYIDDQRIWSFATEEPLQFGTMRGSAYALIPMSEDYSNHTLTILMTNPYSTTSSEFAGVFYGTPGEMKYDLLWHNLWRLIIFFVFWVTALFFFLLNMYHKIHHVDRKNEALIYFSLLIFCVGAWLLMDPSIMQFITSNTVVPQYLSFTLLICIGSFYMGLCSCLFTKQSKPFDILEWIGYALFIIMLFLYLVFSFYITIKHHREYAFSKTIIVGTIILLAGTILAIASFLRNPMRSYAVI